MGYELFDTKKVLKSDIFQIIWGRSLTGIVESGLHSSITLP